MLESSYRLSKRFWSSTVRDDDGWSVEFRASASRIDSFVYRVDDQIVATVGGEGGGGGFVIDATTLHGPDAAEILNRIAAACRFSFPKWSVEIWYGPAK
jgi:hypothetical protein